jgi:hypothetical protein
MLSIGIAVMAVSIVVGVVALTVGALLSSTARSTGRRLRTAMALDRPGNVGSTSDPAEPPYQPAWQEAPYQPGEEYPPYDPAEQEAPYQPGEEYPPDGPAEQEAPYQPGEEYPPNDPAENEVPYEPADQDAPRWVLVSAVVSGAGLVLGLLLVMIASIP